MQLSAIAFSHHREGEIPWHAPHTTPPTAKLKEQKIPRADDIGRAMITAAARRAPADMHSLYGQVSQKWMRATLDELQKAGFDREECKARLRATIIERRRRCK